MTTSELTKELYQFITPTYPDIVIKVEDSVDNVRSIYFIDDKLKMLYSIQRYHYLFHLIPKAFYEQNLLDTIWFELATDEDPDDLSSLDQETIGEIKNSILSILKDKIDFVSTLDTKFSSENSTCFGDFRNSKKILTNLDFSEEDQYDIFHVLMNEGAYCDCEILYNVFRESEYSKNYWNKKNS